MGSTILPAKHNTKSISTWELQESKQAENRINQENLAVKKCMTRSMNEPNYLWFSVIRLDVGNQGLNNLQKELRGQCSEEHREERYIQGNHCFSGCMLMYLFENNIEV
jgi:hypothetical protein